MPRHLTLALCR